MQIKYTRFGTTVIQWKVRGSSIFQNLPDHTVKDLKNLPINKTYYTVSYLVPFAVRQKSFHSGKMILIHECQPLSHAS